MDFLGDNNENQDNPATLKEKIKELEKIISNQSNELLSSKRKIHTLTNTNRTLKLRINNAVNVKLIQTKKTLSRI